MAALPPLQVVLDLDSLDELFNAPAVNPFSSRELAILGEAGVEHLQKSLLKNWPRFPKRLSCTLRLPAEQIEAGLVERTRLAFQRYCTEQAADNRLRQANTLHSALGQLGMACILLPIALGAFYLGFINPPGYLPPLLSQILALLIVLAGGVALFDALWSLMFDWLPYYQKANTLERLLSIDLSIEPIHY